MAKISGNSIQLGDSATATNNFVLQTALDGTAKLSRGNLGATTQDVLTVGADGKVTLPNNIIPAFSAYQSVAQSLPTTTPTKLRFQTKEFDTASTYDEITDFRFTPLVSGYYQINGGFRVATSITYVSLLLYKNGSNVKELANRGNPQDSGAQGSALIFMNGSTDYLELFVRQSAAAQNTVATSISTYFQACLVRVA
jgi:hypothetical protein